MSTGAERIAEERARQLGSHGFDADHDDEHDGGELIAAAICYAAQALGCRVYVKNENANSVSFDDLWPWEVRWDARSYDGNVIAITARNELYAMRLLEKAGALIAAEIDRRSRNP